MSTFAKVLLATDLTPQSDNLTECLFSLCPDTETEVVLAHVFDDDDDADPDGSNYKKVNSRLEGYKNDLEQAGYEEVTVVTPVGDEPFEAICDAGEEHEADLLMVASHGKGFLKSTIMGSTTFDLARATTLPLFISKEDNKDASKLLDTILIPTDFSQKSLDCLNVVRGLREYIGNVIFVHVIERYRSKEEYKEKYGNAKLFLQELVDELKIFGIKADYHIGRGAASKEIVHVSRQEHASLIIIAKTGAGLVKGLVMGSTAQNVVLNSTCGILLLPAEDALDD
ncbi:MAG: universal stress protein [Phascolarctobacterium sp.]|nr:universal stress protein [Phascolarctobacterium sp.]MBR5582398.1 universal stress protein [Phascolarctobacterium sp.]MBR6511666.1 universal stress protein [Phascolarctobacterium sp.]